ncbi:MAG: alpha/beta hydrolase [Algicola sp.]|nr:alpha/beta hydrolase [Algicola sp.]
MVGSAVKLIVRIFCFISLVSCTTFKQSVFDVKGAQNNSDHRVLGPSSRQQLVTFSDSPQMQGSSGEFGEKRFDPRGPVIDEIPPFYVWFGTNRKPIVPSNARLGFTGIDGQRMYYGVASVKVPKSHAFGATGSTWVWRYVMGTDDRLKIMEMRTMDGASFSKYLQQKLDTVAVGKRTALVYIHGYNTDFEEAVIRAAQIGYDLKLEGVMALFSWPSKGAYLAYSADEATITASERHLGKFLRNILKNPNIEHLNILAHSMGNRALMRTVERLSNDPTIEHKSINQIILAAPDVHVNTFAQLAQFYPKVASKTTLYVSSKDLTLSGSKFFHTDDRVGYKPPIIVIPGIDTISVDNIDLSILGHSYFAEAAAVLYDIHQLLSGKLDPNERIRLKPSINDKGLRYWNIAQ